MTIILRAYQPSDTPALMAIYQSAITAIDDQIYDDEQKAAWIDGVGKSASKARLLAWHQRLLKSQSLVAINANNELMGFIEYLPYQDYLDQDKGHGAGDNTTEEAYIDMLFVDPSYQKQGVAYSLVATSLQQLFKLKTKTIWVHASKSAKPFFIKQGFQQLETQRVQRHGVVLERYLMKKDL